MVPAVDVLRVLAAVRGICAAGAAVAIIAAAAPAFSAAEGEVIAARPAAHVAGQASRRVAAACGSVPPQLCRPSGPARIGTRIDPTCCH